MTSLIAETRDTLVCIRTVSLLRNQENQTARNAAEPDFRGTPQHFDPWSLLPEFATHPRQSAGCLPEDLVKLHALPLAEEASSPFEVFPLTYSRSVALP